MDALEYKSVAVSIRNAIYDMEGWPEQHTVKTVTGRIVECLCATFLVHDKDFDANLFRTAIYEEDEDIPF